MVRSLKSAQLSSVPRSEDVRQTVASIIEAVRAHGDDAVREWSQKLDGWAPSSFLLSGGELQDIVRGLPRTVVEDLEEVQKHVWHFARRQLDSLHDFEVEVSPGVYLGQRNIPSGLRGRMYLAGATHSRRQLT